MAPVRAKARKATPRFAGRGISPKEASARTGISLTTVYGLCRDGLIECQQLRKVWLIFTDEKGRLIPIKAQHAQASP